MSDMAMSIDSLSHFKLIVPCDLTDVSTVSLRELTGETISMTDARRAVVEAFEEVFSVKFEE